VAVPKRAVNEHGDAAAAEDEVGPAWDALGVQAPSADP
jgi:hypothetical protein